MWHQKAFPGAALLIGLLTVTEAFGQTYTIRTLGPAPIPPTFSSVGKALNNKDEVLADGVFGSYSGTPSLYLPLPDYGMPAGLDYLPFSGFTNFTGLTDGWIIVVIAYQIPTPFPRAFNDQGQILGTLSTPSHAGIWQNRQVRDLGTLGGPISIPFGLNQQGDVIGYSTTIPGDTLSMENFIVLAGTTQMQPIAGLAHAGLRAFNNQRQILASTTNGDVVWQNGVGRKATEFFGFDEGPALVPDPNHPGVYDRPDGTYNTVSVRGLNDLGEILGYLSTTVVRGSTNISTFHSFIFSPTGGHGFQRGLNYDVLRYESGSPDVPRDHLIAWNSTGQIIFVTDYTQIGGPLSTYHYWDKGHVHPLQSLVPAGSGWTDLTPYGINDRGDIVGQGSLNGVYQGFLLAVAPLAVTASIGNSGRIVTGDQIIVQVNATNFNATDVIGNVQEVALPTVAGAGGAQFQSGPSPAGSVTLNPGQGVTFTTLFLATNDGTVTFSATVAGTDPKGAVSASGTSAPLVILPPLSLDISTIPALRASVNDAIEVHATVSNRSTIGNSILKQVSLKGPPVVTGSGGVALQLGPMPPGSVTLNPGTSFTFTNLFLATNYGPVTFSATATGTESNGKADSVSGATSPLQILPIGDLLIRRGFETNYAGGGIYQSMAAPPQILTNAVVTNEPSSFQVQIVNASKEALTYTIRAREGNHTGWNLQYKIGGQDLTSQLESPSGFVLPELVPGGSLVLDAAIMPLAAALGTSLGVEFDLGFAKDPSLTLDSVSAVTVVAWVPVRVKFHGLDIGGPTRESLYEGTNDITAPLLPNSDPSLLQRQPVLESASLVGDTDDLGLVADGITPLLVEVDADPNDLRPFPEGRKFRGSVKLRGGGTLKGIGSGDSLPAEAVLVFDPTTGSWTNDPQFRLTADHPTAYLWITAIASEDIVLVQSILNPLSNGYELAARVIVADAVNNAEAQVGSGFRIRKPPIFLLHGYNSAGDWGSTFRGTLSTRYQALSETSADNFVRTIKYGQDSATDQATGAGVFANTAYSLEDCADLANIAMETARNEIQKSWSMTRFDVVGHSQGGVLTRMLSNANASSKIREPFRSFGNLFRGRFHRIVTLGAPHNGARLLHYLAKLSEQKVSAVSMLRPILQAKFDPFGQQIRDLNNPDPGAPWYPDVAAQFHLVRTHIDGGRSPARGDTTPAYRLMGLAQAGGGAAVIPGGADGVVDYDSAGANVPPASAGANVYEFSIRDIAHTTLKGLFGTDEDQVDSIVLGRHVLHALDQSSTDPSENIQFGSFQVPPLLDDSQKKLIDDWAAQVIFAANAAKITTQPSGASPLQVRANPGMTYLNQVEYLGGQLPQGDIDWVVSVYGPSGITTNGVTLTLQGANNGQALVTVDGALVGDVVLQAFYIDAANEVAVTPAQLVVSRPPPGVTLTGLSLLPFAPALPVGTEVDAFLVAHYSNGSSSLRYVSAEQVEASSSNTNVVSLLDPLRWDLLSAGGAQIVVTWAGLKVTNQVTAFVSTPAVPSLAIRGGNNGSLTLSWPSWAADYVLERSSDLALASFWQAENVPPVQNGLQLTVVITRSHQTEYFRLRR